MAARTAAAAGIRGLDAHPVMAADERRVSEADMLRAPAEAAIQRRATGAAVAADRTAVAVDRMAAVEATAAIAKRNSRRSGNVVKRRNDVSLPRWDA